MSKRDARQIRDLEQEIVARLEAMAAPNTKAIRVLRLEYSKQLTMASHEVVVCLALRLAHRSDNFPQFFAFELVQHHPQALRSLRAGVLADLGRNIDSWGAVDAFACYLAGPSWREQQISDALVRRWARAPSRWWRRAALVSTVALNNKTRGGHGDSSRTLMICEMLLEDRDEMVVKALSWALRELAKRDPHSVRDFLDKHAAVLAPLLSGKSLTNSGRG